MATVEDDDTHDLGRFDSHTVRVRVVWLEGPPETGGLEQILGVFTTQQQAEACVGRHVIRGGSQQARITKLNLDEEASLD